MLTRLVWIATAVLTLAACSSSGTAMPSAPPQATATSGIASATAISALALPLGDGHVGSAPQEGWVDSCITQFPPAGGASREGPWIHGATWDATAKIAVRGAVRWPQASYSAQISGGQRVISTNDLPVGFTTGIFPIQAADPAFAYDRNPNTIRAQSVRFALPIQPAAASVPGCLGLGPIGVLTDGVLLYNGLDAEGRDAVAHELQDSCGGHPDMRGEYHYHEVSPCLLQKASGTSTLVGYALDGFGIYVERDASGALLTDADLDACHGRTSMVTWDGRQVSVYHYVATEEYPYTVGCFRGTPVVR
jgi:hypothetical protein